ncbi:hypothetical protein [Celeribacter marinus]|uniref:hypothetical protein n=1 Tax=Celeribacter marinus TaxID=1397108 RepID=UPI003F6C48AE
MTFHTRVHDDSGGGEIEVSCEEPDQCNTRSETPYGVSSRETFISDLVDAAKRTAAE